ncbi:HNH endonuclease [Blastococcus sp. TBT05-19]|uniref:HNH endonuclease n=1 Tax=Blastococcus sp. TBT05-19 TaxID=2250581 RepID=UPI0018F72C96|nr:HNH endonuclease [Blastococcus sp. TBT05-19]
MQISRGGTHTWDNVVAACRRCNHTKADRSLAELGWKLPQPPRTPSGAAWRLLGGAHGRPALAGVARHAGERQRLRAARGALRCRRGEVSSHAVPVARASSASA